MVTLGRFKVHSSVAVTARGRGHPLAFADALHLRLKVCRVVKRVFRAGTTGTVLAVFGSVGVGTSSTRTICAATTTAIAGTRAVTALRICHGRNYVW